MDDADALSPVVFNEASQMAPVFARVVESSPVIVLVLCVVGYLFWTTWRSERRDMLSDFRAEREAMVARWESERKEILEKWQRDRDSLLEEMREERAARTAAYREIIAVADRGNLAVTAVKDTINELRRAIESGEHRR